MPFLRLILGLGFLYLVYAPVFLNDWPLWLVVSAISLDYISRIVHACGHGFGCAYYDCPFTGITLGVYSFSSRYNYASETFPTRAGETGAIIGVLFLKG